MFRSDSNCCGWKLQVVASCIAILRIYLYKWSIYTYIRCRGIEALVDTLKFTISGFSFKVKNVKKLKVSYRHSPFLKNQGLLNKTLTRDSSFLPEKSLNNVSNIHGQKNQEISWEKPKRKDDNVQCHRCQRWGHISRNCNSAYNGVKYEQEHTLGECQRTREFLSDPYYSDINLRIWWSRQLKMLPDL